MRKSASLLQQYGAMYRPRRVAEDDRTPWVVVEDVAWGVARARTTRERMIPGSRAAVPSPVFDDEPLRAFRGIALGMALGLGLWIVIGFGVWSLLA